MPNQRDCGPIMSKILRHMSHIPKNLLPTVQPMLPWKKDVKQRVMMMVFYNGRTSFTNDAYMCLIFIFLKINCNKYNKIYILYV